MIPPANRSPRTNRQALLRYSAVWLLGGVAAALVVVVALRGSTDLSPRRAPPDPLRAVVASGCVLEDPRGRSAKVSRPPVTGSDARPVAAGVYDAPQPRERLVGSLRRGLVVIQYERRLSVDRVIALRRAFGGRGSPRLILTPDGTGMPFTVAATAWGRVLGCSKLDQRVVSALRTFVARYGGRGPDARG